jgi:hypothetical protein
MIPNQVRANNRRVGAATFHKLTIVIALAWSGAFSLGVA